MKSKSLKFLTGAFALSLASMSTGHATTYIWDGVGGSDSNWSTKQNWDLNTTLPTTSAANDIQFAGPNRTGPVMETSYVINKLTFNSDAAAFILTSSSGWILTILGGGIINSSNSLQTINITTITLGASQTWNADTGSLVFGGTTVNLGASQTLTIDGSNNTSIGNQITGTGTSGIIKNGNGTLTLSASNTYTGNTTINAGTLALASTGSIAAGSAIIKVESGAILDVSAKGGWTVQGINSTFRQLLTGSGGVTGATVIGSFGSHSAGSSGVGTQAFSSSLTYSTGSIFQWDLDVLSASTESHDKVTANSLAGSGAIFQVVLGSGDTFADAFWNADRNWSASDLFGANNANVNLSTIFSDATTTTNFTANSLEGLFSFTSTGGAPGNQLTWTAVPEPTSALAGILLGAGLLRRRRSR